MRIDSTLLVAASLALAACGGGLSDERHPTGSASIAADAAYDRVYVAQPDAGTVAVVEPGDGVLDQIDVGGEPTRIARAGDQMFVTVRTTGEVVVIDTTTRAVSMRIPVGPDPYGIVAAESGDLVFATVGLDDKVVQIDPMTGEITRSFSVPGQPRWLALHPSGKSLYVGSAFGGTWSHIDLRTDEVTTHTPPARFREGFEMMDDEGRIVDSIQLTPRITGDLAVSSDGELVAVPVFYVDNTSPVGSNEQTGQVGGGGYAASGPGVGRTNPSVLLVEAGNDGDPSLTRQRTLFAQGHLQRDAQDFDLQMARSYLSSVTFAPDGLTVVATMEGSDALITLPVTAAESGEGKRFAQFDGMEFGGGGFEFPSAVMVSADSGPRGVVFLDREQAFVDSWLDHSVARVPYTSVFESLRRSILEEQDVFFSGELHSVSDAIPAGEDVLDPEVVQGRRLFFSATDSAMAAHSGGISCATCHFDGRNDGLTWTFAMADGLARRQTPSLAGVVSETTPVTWTSDVESVAMEVRLTSRDRMGGSGATVSQSYDVEAYIDTTPYPSLANASLDPAAVERGREIFHGTAECATCHSGAQYTDRIAYDMFGLTNVMTPTLRGIAATGPYLHDGAAPDLRALVEMAEAGGMGKTNHLTPDQKDDLVTFLRSL